MRRIERMQGQLHTAFLDLRMFAVLRGEDKKQKRRRAMPFR